MLQGIRPGKCYVEMSTVDPETITELSQVLSLMRHTHRGRRRVKVLMFRGSVHSLGVESLGDIGVCVCVCVRSSVYSRLKQSVPGIGSIHSFLIKAVTDD